VSLALTLPGGATISTVHYSIVGGGLLFSGTIDVSDPQTTVATVFVGSVPAGDYTVTMNATASDGASCSGSMPITVVPNETAIADIVIACTRGSTTGQVAVNGTFETCPGITGVSASSLQATQGSDISIGVAATDLDGDTLAYSWSTTPGTSSIGTLVLANTSSPLFHCVGVGTTQLSVAVSDGVCGDQRIDVIPITCIAGTMAPPAIEVDAFCADSSAQSQINLSMRIINPSNRDIDWGDIKIRYFYSGDGTVPVVDFDLLQNPTWSNMPSLVTTRTTAAYLELGFQPFAAGTLSAFDLTAGSGQMQMRIHPADFHAWDASQLDDYSFSDSVHPCSGMLTQTFQPRLTITGYVQGLLSWGVEPP
jgi:hypothetical protein